MRKFGRRLIQAATLDPTFYDECIENRRLVWPALLVVVAGGAAGVMGQYIGRDFVVDALLEKMLWATLIWTLGWPVLAGVAYAVGRWILGGKGSFGGVFRGMGWAFTPGLLQIAIAFPPLQFVAFAVPMVWMVATGMAATGRTLRISNSRAMIATLLAWGVWAVVGIVLMVIQGILPTFTM
jgi:hypothetical protein